MFAGSELLFLTNMRSEQADSVFTQERQTGGGSAIWRNPERFTKQLLPLVFRLIERNANSYKYFARQQTAGYLQLGILRRDGFDLLPPEKLDDTTLTAKLWKRIREPAPAGGFFPHIADHLNDRELYVWLLGDGLREEMMGHASVNDQARPMRQRLRARHAARLQMFSQIIPRLLFQRVFPSDLGDVQQHLLAPHRSCSVSRHSRAASVPANSTTVPPRATHPDCRDSAPDEAPRLFPRR